MTSPTVLVLRALGLGDAVTGIAPLRGVRRAWPDHRLVLAAPAAFGQWLLELGVVDETLDVGPLEPVPWPAPEPPAVAVNLHGRGPQTHRLLLALRPGRLVAFANAEAGHADGPPWDESAHEVDQWCSLVTWAGGRCGPDDLRLEPPLPRGDVVVVHPGATTADRRWPVARWHDVVRALRADGAHVAVTGSGDEASLCAEVATAGADNLAGTLSLADLARVVASARVLLSGDTGVAHLATAYATPSVTLFGSIPPWQWGPRIDRGLHRVLWHPEAEGPAPADEPDPRLLAVPVAEVLAEARSLLGTPGGAAHA